MPPASSIPPVDFPAVPAAASPLAAMLILFVLLTVAVYMELKEGRIPNWLTLAGMAAGLLVAFLHGQPVFWSSLGGLLIGFGFLFIFYLFNGVGGGDVKLMGAVGALLGAELIKPALFYTTFIGAFLAVMIFVWRKDFWLRVSWGLQNLVFWRQPEAKQLTRLPAIKVPYGIAIATGCVLALLARGS